MGRIERILSARAAALDALTHAAGGDSLCTLSRERLPATKYHEGAVAALGDAVRAERSGSTAPDAARWGAAFAARAEHDPNWHAYLVGGRDALASLAVESSATGPLALAQRGPAR